MEAERATVPFPGRLRLVGRALVAVLPELGDRPRVLDCGGGTGSVAVPLAAAGAHVTVLDISADALATARRRADEAGVGDRISTTQTDLDAVSGADGGDGADPPPVVAAGTFDLVLVHDVLGALDDPVRALRTASGLVRAGGMLSVVVPNRAAVVLSRALAGDPAAALAELREPGAEGIDAADLLGLVAELGLTVRHRAGLGVFADLLPSGPADSRPYDLATLRELEDLASVRPPLRDIAARVHVLAQRGAPDRD